MVISLVYLIVTTVRKESNQHNYKNAPIALQELVNRIVLRKIILVVLWLTAFLVGCSYLYFPVMLPVDQRTIYFHILTWICLIRGMMLTIPTIFLYRGNKNEDIRTLKTFLCIGFLSYTLVDCMLSRNKVVKARIMEIMAKNADKENSASGPTNCSIPAPIV